jgi:hypothetical protein|tara:strand:- start:2797 stop:3252 length:456 start_codon:yes stop_codon:yes gene_type:complete
MQDWNVYKVFANGKRAKSPYTTFEATESGHFFESILPTFSAKLRKSKWVVLSVNDSQEREAEAVDEEKEKFDLDKQRVLSKIAAREFPHFADRRLEACLILSKSTEWKWAWCLVQRVTHVYFGHLSPQFDTAIQAEEWIKEQIECSNGNGI